MRRPGTSVEDVYRVLRERILKGQYAPGYRMSQEALARELSVSRTPLREAFQRLESDKLLLATTNRGMEVSPIRLDSAEEDYAIRLLIEPPMMEGIVDRFCEADYEEMSKHLELMQVSTGRIYDFQQAHLDFHNVAVQKYTPTIRSFTLDLHRRIYRAQRVYMSRPQVPHDFTVADALYLEAVRARNAERARRLLEFHLIDAVIGLVLDVDPDHEFTALLDAAAGNGIRIQNEGGAIRRPAAVSWRVDPGLPKIATNNIIHHLAV